MRVSGIFPRDGTPRQVLLNHAAAPMGSIFFPRPSPIWLTHRAGILNFLLNTMPPASW